MKKIVTFGEIMLRLAPPGFQRFTQARTLEATYGGGEANVAVSLANYGETIDFVTRLPKNDLGDACISTLRGLGVGTSYIVRGGERIGIYFLETGAAQRASKVIYDRAGSSFATIQPVSIDWKTVFADADWFHWTGITPAVSQGAAEVCREAILAAREMGITISTDLNYRAKLWKWGKTAGEVMSDLVGMLLSSCRTSPPQGAVLETNTELVTVSAPEDRIAPPPAYPAVLPANLVRSTTRAVPDERAPPAFEAVFDKKVVREIVPPRMLMPPPYPAESRTITSPRAPVRSRSS